MNLGVLNLAIILAFFASQIWLGLHFSRGQKTSDNYFLGGRGFAGWVLGISMIGAIISSITFIAGPADTFKTAWLRTAPQLVIPFGALIVAYWIMPFFRRGTIVSAYAYLNRRFGRSISVYAALVYLVGQIVRTSVILYLLAILLQGITGFSFATCLLSMGAVTAVYTAKGGFSAVIWTDLVQCFILTMGAVLCVAVVVVALPGGLGEVFDVAREHHKLSFWDIGADHRLAPVTWGFSLSEKSVTALMLAGLLAFVGSTLDQANVQRWCAARSVPAARSSILILGFGALPIWIAFKFVGTCLFAFYERFPDTVSTAVLDGSVKAEEIMPHFIMTSLPNGIAGLVISGALAAAMSTLSACVNSSAMVWVRDLYEPLLARGRGDAHYLRVGKTAAWAVSAVMIGGAWLVYLASAATLADLVLMIGGILGGTVPAVFLLGMLTRRANLGGICAGVAVSTLFLAWMSLGEMGLVRDGWRLPCHIYYSGLLGNLLTFAVGYAVSLVVPARSRALTNLTVWDDDGRPLV